MCFTTELVQTDAIVVDRQGRFVDNLQREQFELRVDGRPQRISFFERVPAGPPVKEEAQTAPPDVTLKVEVFRDEKLVSATPLSRLKTEGVADLSRIPYFVGLKLEGMPSGRYVLHVTATDRIARANASQRMNFEIE